MEVVMGWVVCYSMLLISLIENAIIRSRWCVSISNSLSIFLNIALRLRLTMR